MTERREPLQGRRRTDRRFLLQPITGLLVGIVILQVVLVVLHSRRNSQDRQPVPAPVSNEPVAMADALLKLELASAEPEVRQLAGQLKRALDTEARRVSFGVSIGDVRVESATGIGEMIVSARLQNNAPVPLGSILCRLQLRDAAGVLLYQATGELSDTSTGAWLPGDSALVRFLVDNPPPEFERAAVVLDRLDFAAKGFWKGEG